MFPNSVCKLRDSVTYNYCCKAKNFNISTSVRNTTNMYKLSLKVFISHHGYQDVARVPIDICIEGINCGSLRHSLVLRLVQNAM